MNIALPLTKDIVLQVTSGNNNSAYPTAKIQKGLRLLFNGEDWSEEGVGFGVPILKRGLVAIFPSEVEHTLYETDLYTRIIARYKLNLVEKISRNGTGILNNHFIYTGKYLAAALIRSAPLLRDVLTRTSSLLRSKLDWHTIYEPTDFASSMTLDYHISARDGRIHIELSMDDDLPAGVSEIILMNEQGAHHFDQYRDASGTTLSGEQIGCWDEVHDSEATFLSSAHQISFTLPQVEGARLFRGRELVSSRLAWAGFGYSLPPSVRHFSYDIQVTRQS